MEACYVTAVEVKQLIFINFMFGIHQLPHYTHFWSTDELLIVQAAARVLSRNRYEAISRYFHLNISENFVPEGQEGHDPIFKVRPFFDLVLGKSRENMNPEREISIDEAMVAFTGRQGFKQYIKSKPCPWGIKIWCGYLFNFYVYNVKSQAQQQNGLRHHIDTN
ncbi:PiggyBac transposable element-derived protein 4-like [Plakobranchus ocellatus]|uniref:PiggyBac transposable element-derived protein 4-like n=1 Tax=Plakobranchus ocellatus TaxID=259542 RepID=A0AAV4CML4_9GAST|nr:PiggyBac transposable element-derived protein 4-like [Plakobranchus ocellatus]